MFDGVHLTTGHDVPQPTIGDILEACRQARELAKRLDEERRAELIDRAKVDPEFRNELILELMRLELEKTIETGLLNPGSYAIVPKDDLAGMRYRLANR